MTPQQFSAAYLPTAQTVSAGTGIDPYVLLAQWALETGWGESFAGQYNLGNIRSASGPFLNFASLADFAFVAIETWHNGFYLGVLASAGQSAADQIAAIGASPWDAGHYGSPAGSHLLPYYQQLAPPAPTKPRRPLILSTGTSTNLFVRGLDNELFHNRFDGTAWSGWKDLGGSLSQPDIAASAANGRIDVYVIGAGGAIYQISSTDDGLTWGPYVALGGQQNGPLAVVGPASAPVATPTPAPAVDLSPVLDSLAAITAKVISIEAKVNKDLA